MAIPLVKTIHEKFFHHSPDLLCIIDRDGRFVEVSQACEQLLGYRQLELAGMPYLEYVIPGDRELTMQAMKQVMSGQGLTDFMNRYRQKSGTEVSLSWSLTWSKEETLFYCLARKTALLHPEAGLNRQAYRILLEDYPDGIFWESSDGFITEANEAFCRITGTSKKSLLGKSVSSFLPCEFAAANQSALQAALQGSTMRFTLELNNQAGEQSVYDAMKHPIIVNRQVVGVQTILKDITPLLRSHELITQQAKKLHTIFESITDGFLLLDREWNFSYFNSEAGRLLSLDRARHTDRNAWEEFPSEIDGVFYRQYHHAAATGEPVNFEAYFASTDRWFDVKAFPSQEGISVYFSDITGMVRARQELNKLSLVASKTTNGVIITDRQLRIDWVNDSFTKITGYTLAESTGHSPFELLHNPKEDKAAIDAFKKKALQGEAVSFEVLRRKKDGVDIWLLVQITPVKDEEANITHFLFVQSDISERVKTREWLEMLSLVASKTINSVIIMDADARVEWVNDSFTHLTGYTLDEATGKRPLDLLRGEETDKATMRRIADSIRQAYPFQEEILIYTKSGEKK